MNLLHKAVCKIVYVLVHFVSFHIIVIRETGLNQTKIKEAHRRIMLLNHPDRGGSPYLALKINEAKDVLEKVSKSKPA